MIKAVGFDIDGTLYPSSSLYIRMIPKTINHLVFLMRYNLLRIELRKESFVCTHGFSEVHSVDEFHLKEAETLVKIFGGDFETILETMETTIYKKSEKMFHHIKLFKGAEQLLARLREAGIATGALSDFPAENKLEYLGIKHFFNVIMTSEECGRLKPFPDSFLKFADALGVEPSKILYVGNSEHYDTAGAKQAGMQTALISRTCKRSQADFVFRSYKELDRYIFSNM